MANDGTSDQARSAGDGDPHQRILVPSTECRVPSTEYRVWAGVTRHSAPGTGHWLSLQFQPGGLLEIRSIIEKDPLDDRDRQRAVGDQVVMKLSEPVARAFRIA